MSLIGEGHTMMGNELFDSIGKDLPMNVLGNINAAAMQGADELLTGTTGTSYHLAIAIGIKYAKVQQLKAEK